MEQQIRHLSVMQTLLSPSELPALRKYRELLDAKIEELERLCVIHELLLRGASLTRFKMLEAATDTPMVFRAEDCERLCAYQAEFPALPTSRAPSIPHELAFPRGTGFRHGRQL